MDEFANYLGTPHWKRQHRWRTAIWRGMSRLGLSGMHALPLNRRWVEIHRRPMLLAGLNPELAGERIVQVSDLHFSPVVWKRYLDQFVEWVNAVEPNLVVITGDLITGGYRYAAGVATVLSRIKATRGVICTFGNHDYSMYGRHSNGEGSRRADYLEKCLTGQGLLVLRNQQLILDDRAGRPALVIVGLDDEWSGHIDAPRAFAGIDGRLPVICLNHNPVNVRELLDFPWQWMLSGHTHGRQLATSRFGQKFYPHRRRSYTHGYYSVEGRHLYVNRGLSYGQRVLHWCRPEITVFKLGVAGPGHRRPPHAITSLQM
jgi:predicted MPP superfamily phosphohydrolase